MTKMTPSQCDDLMISQGLARYDASLAANKAAGTITSSPAGSYLLSEAVAKFTEALREWTRVASNAPGRHHACLKYVKQVKPEVLSLIAARHTLDGVAKGLPYITIAGFIGTEIETEVRIATIQREAKEKWTDIKTVAKKKRSPERRRRVTAALARTVSMDFDAWPMRDRRMLGILLIELFIEHTGLVTSTMHTTSHRGKAITARNMQISASALAWMTNSEEGYRYLSPVYLPTTYEPHDWTDQWDGGYSGNIYTRAGIIAVEGAQLAKLTIDTMPEVYRAINNVQRTPWRINQDVLDMLGACWDEGVVVGEVPSRDSEELPPKPWAEGEVPEATVLKTWKRRAAMVYDANATRANRRARTVRVLTMARKYRHQEFYYPQKGDFRGRFYPVASFLNPQGTDLSKGLLEFANPKELEPTDTEGIAWLMIHGANCWGKDKVPFGERVQWVEEAEAEIRQVARDPLEYRFWAEASEPWQFLAFCLEYDAMVEAHANGQAHTTHLPVGMDGSNNGLQLYSLLLRDPIGAHWTNVSPTDSPEDIYAVVAERTYTRMVEDADGLDEKAAEYARNWIAFMGSYMPRAATKRPVMTLPYGATRFSAREYLNEWYEEEIAKRELRDKRPFGESFNHTRYLADLVWDSIKEIVVGAREAMDWLREVANLCAEAGKPVEWVSPSGMPISQIKFNNTRFRVRTKVGDRIVSREGLEPGTKVSKRGMKNGIAPNFIHSLDAAVLTKTVNLCAAQGITDFAMVHDCYATHCTNASALARNLRTVVADVFSRDLLLEFKRSIEEQLNTELPPLPKYGSLDPTVVRSSLYFFA